MHRYKKLIVWQKSIELVKEIYKQTETFPKNELYGLVSQMRRCAISIPSNIAEGGYRDSNKEFRRFVLIAYGSGAELETQLYIAKELQFITGDNKMKLSEQLEEIMKMLNALQNKFSS